MIARRDFLRKAAAAGTGAFVVPTIITVDPADAQALTSPPPEPPGAQQPESPTTDLTSPPGAAASGGAGGRTQLPRTGADLDRLAAAGLAATAGGAALVLWSADAKPKSTPVVSEPPDPQTET
jgi:hypothetical protein